jgi:hypothetical protein
LILQDFKSLCPEVLILRDYKCLFSEVLILVGLKSLGMREMRKFEKILEVLILGELWEGNCKNKGIFRVRGGFGATGFESVRHLRDPHMPRLRRAMRECEGRGRSAMRRCSRVIPNHSIDYTHMSIYIYGLFEYVGCFLSAWRVRAAPDH